MHSDLQQKTAFTTTHGLFEFCVMTKCTGCLSTPQAATGLNPTDGPDFVSVYLDDILVFSPSLTDCQKQVSSLSLVNATL